LAGLLFKDSKGRDRGAYRSGHSFYDRCATDDTDLATDCTDLHRL
jgi:hypothetical protein